jgi:hypothetical protein
LTGTSASVRTGNIFEDCSENVVHVGDIRHV